MTKQSKFISEDEYLDDEITFESIDLTLPVAELYHRVVNQDMTEWLESQRLK
ncbi:MAG: hypothetical protein HRT35_24875 [Algicola sp.]|nr:hypothetical protein [Algicola sp.]